MMSEIFPFIVTPQLFTAKNQTRSGVYRGYGRAIQLAIEAGYQLLQQGVCFYRGNGRLLSLLLQPRLAPGGRLCRGFARFDGDNQ
jgi:hypothetical protein